MLIALAALTSCACFVTALALLWRRKVIRREDDKAAPPYVPGGNDKWIAWYPDPPPPDNLHVFSRGDLFYDGKFRPTVTPSGLVHSWAQQPPPPPPAPPPLIGANLAPPTPVPAGLEVHPALALPVPRVHDVAAASLAQRYR